MDVHETVSILAATKAARLFIPIHKVYNSDQFFWIQPIRIANFAKNKTKKQNKKTKQKNTHTHKNHTQQKIKSTGLLQQTLGQTSVIPMTLTLVSWSEG